MRNYNRKRHLSAGRGAGRRLAVLAGAVMLAFASPLSVWAEEADKGGDTMESAVMVPAFPGGQEESQGTSEPSAPSSGTTDGTASSEPASSGSQTTEEGTATKIIRTENGTGTAASDTVSQATSGTDYSLGPGFANQQTTQIQQSLDQSSAASNAQIYDVTNPVVKPVEKYSYDQMVQDINTLKAKYGSKMQVNTIGTSLD